MGTRNTDGDTTGSKRSVTTQLLQELQGENGVFLVGATNTPWQIDPAFVRRFDQAFYIRLPNYEERLQLFNNLFKRCEHGLLKIDIQELALQTEGYTSADILRMLRNASARRMKKMTIAKWVSTSGDGKWFPCSNRFPKAVRRETISDKDLIPPPLSPVDIEMSFVNITVKPKDIKKFNDFERLISSMSNA